MSAGRSIDEILEKCRKAGVYSGSRISINEKDALGDTPLHIAAAQGDKAAVEALIRAGAEINAVGDRGRTPLFSASNAEVAKVLVAAGADVNHCDEQGMTTRELAKILGRLDIEQLLSSLKKK